MEFTTTQTVAEIVASDYRTADVFKSFGIDFCCGGKAKLEDICRRKELDSAEVLSALTQLFNSDQTAPDFKSWKADQLIRYIVENHHQYITKNIGIIREYAKKVALVHGLHRPEVVQIADLFEEIAKELLTHLQKEEIVLFPYILDLQQAAEGNGQLLQDRFTTVQSPIRMMETEHETVGNWFHQIAEFSNQYNPPAEACNTFIVLYAKLKEFEEDLHTHIHLENNLLFPMALQLEKNIR